MLVRTSKLIKERSLSTVLITCKRKSKQGSMRKFLLLSVVMVDTTLTKSRMMLMLLLVFILVLILIRTLLYILFVFIIRRIFTILSNRHDFDLLCISKSQSKLVAMNPKLHRVTHWCKLNKCNFHSRNHTHIKEMLSQRSLSTDRVNNAGLAYRQFS